MGDGGKDHLSAFHATTVSFASQKKWPSIVVIVSSDAKLGVMTAANALRLATEPAGPPACCAGQKVTPIWP
jgi:hypothetical protein